MVDDATVLKVERLRDDLAQLQLDLRRKYAGATGRRRQVTANQLRQQAGKLAEIWLVEVASRREIARALGDDYVGDLSVHFTRLLTMSQQAAIRASYETEINGILRDFTVRAVIPLKQARAAEGSPELRSPAVEDHVAVAFTATAFLGHSFADPDAPIVAFVRALFEAIGFRVVSGEKPKTSRISDKVKKLIDDQHLFVGIFTRRDRIGRKNAWTTSAWVIDEKAYAVAKDKVLVLLAEEGVDNIGGLQGDYEYIRFARNRLHEVVPKILGLFQIAASGVAL